MIWFLLARYARPSACHVQAARLDIEAGEWIMAFIPAEELDGKTWTHWAIVSPPQNTN